jgi:hypothetical protein
MSFMNVSGEEVRAAQMLTTATFTSFLVVGFVPGLRAHAQRIRMAILIVYLVAVAGFIGYLLVR